MAANRERFAGREPQRPDRVRRIDESGFAFVPNRFLRDGFLATLSPEESRLYFLLVLAADRRGMSFYHYDSICSLLAMDLDDYLAARDGLIWKDLVAYDGTSFQVLSLPSAPKRAPPQPPSSPVADAHERHPEIRGALLAAIHDSQA